MTSDFPNLVSSHNQMVFFLFQVGSQHAIILSYGVCTALWGAFYCIMLLSLWWKFWNPWHWKYNEHCLWLWSLWKGSGIMEAVLEWIEHVWGGFMSRGEYRRYPYGMSMFHFQWICYVWMCLSRCPVASSAMTYHNPHHWTSAHPRRFYQLNCFKLLLLIMKLNMNNATTMGIYLLKKINLVERTWTRHVSDLPSNGQLLPKQVILQLITGALPVTSFVPITHVVMHLTMLISVM